MALNINGTTGISGVDGSVSAPALTGTDSNTGITFPSADTIKFSTGGVERMQITNSGVSGTGIGAGKMLQVVQGTLTGQTGHASSSLGDLGLSASITPQTNSKVLALISIQANIDYKTNRGYGIALLRDSTATYTDPLDYAVQGNSNASVGDGRVKSNWHILDSSPGGDGSTSITYKIQVKTHGGRQIIFQEGGCQSSLTLIEIGA